MLTLQLCVILGCLLLGTRFGGMGLGLISGIGLFILCFVFHVQPGKPLRDYITDYEVASENKMIDEFVQTFGLDKGQLVKLLAYSLTETNLNEYSRFDRLRDTVDKAKAKAYFEQLEGKPVSPPMVNVKFNALLKDFVLSAAKE